MIHFIREWRDTVYCAECVFLSGPQCLQATIGPIHNEISNSPYDLSPSVLLYWPKKHSHSSSSTIQLIRTTGLAEVVNVSVVINLLQGKRKEKDHLSKLFYVTCSSSSSSLPCSLFLFPTTYHLAHLENIVSTDSHQARPRHLVHFGRGQRLQQMMRMLLWALFGETRHFDAAQIGLNCYWRRWRLRWWRGKKKNHITNHTTNHTLATVGYFDVFNLGDIFTFKTFRPKYTRNNTSLDPLEANLTLLATVAARKSKLFALLTVNWTSNKWTDTKGEGKMLKWLCVCVFNAGASDFKLDLTSNFHS